MYTYYMTKGECHRGIETFKIKFKMAAPIGMYLYVSFAGPFIFSTAPKCEYIVYVYQWQISQNIEIVKIKFKMATSIGGDE